MRLTLTTLIAFFAISTQACECLWQGSFVKAAPKTDLIVSGTVTRKKGNAIDLAIDRTLKGKEFRETIRIWGDDGKQCRPSVDVFPIGSQWVMGLHQISQDVPGGFNPNTPNISYGRVNDYYLSKCGAYWLEMNDGYVTGNLIDGQRWQWQTEKMSPVLIELIDAFVLGALPEAALREAAKPQTERKKLMDETRQFLRSQ